MLQLDNPLFDPIASQYAADLERLANRALAGELDEREYRDAVERLTVAMITAVYLLGGGDPTSAQGKRFLAEQGKLARDSARALAGDLFDGRYSEGETRTAEQGKDSLLARLALWTFTLGKVYHRAKVTNPASASELLTWRFGSTEEHCATCAGLNGQTKTADEWANLAFLDIEPQGTGLECGGWRCDCAIS